MGIRWRDGLNVFNMGKVIKLPKTVVHKGHVWLSMKGWRKDCGSLSEKKAKMNKFIKVWNTAEDLMGRGTCRSMTV